MTSEMQRTLILWAPAVVLVVIIFIRGVNFRTAGLANVPDRAIRATMLGTGLAMGWLYLASEYTGLAANHGDDLDPFRDILLVVFGLLLILASSAPASHLRRVFQQFREAHRVDSWMDDPEIRNRRVADSLVGNPGKGPEPVAVTPFAGARGWPGGKAGRHSAREMPDGMWVVVSVGVLALYGFGAYLLLRGKIGLHQTTKDEFFHGITPLYVAFIWVLLVVLRSFGRRNAVL